MRSVLFVFIGESKNCPGLNVGLISKAESAARLFANGLNQLSHPGDGLPTAAAIANTVPAYVFTGGTVEARARSIRTLLDEMVS